jgi:mannose-6-phosphate isomerase-like protein (cupin superfamily)
VAYKGQVIYNPVTHERFTFISTSRDSEGRTSIFDCEVAPGGVALPPHVHTNQEERFWVLSGTLGVMLDGRKYTLYPGQTIVLPAGLKHQWWNAGEFDVRFRVEVSPSRNFETIVEAAAGMAQAGKLNNRGMPKNPFLMAILARKAECYMPVVPIWMQKVMLTMGSTLGTALGYNAECSRYQTLASNIRVQTAAGPAIGS